MNPDLHADAIRRVAFVTRRFHELRGLIPATFGAALILAAFAEQASGADGRGQYSAFQPLLFANLVMTLAMVPLDRGYRQTFGQPVATARHQATSGLFPFVALIAGMIDVFVPLPASLMSTAVAIFGAWIVVRDWPSRMHYGTAVVAGLLAASASVLDPSGQGIVRGYFPIGLAIVVAGLGDHQLLAASLPGHVSGTPQTQGGSGRSFDRVVVSMLLAAAGTVLVIADRPTAPFLWPIVLFTLLIGIQVFLALPAALRGIREYSRNGRVTPAMGPNLNLGDRHLVLLFAASVAAVAESALALRGLLAFTLTAIFVSLGIRTRAMRMHYLAISIVFAVAGVVGRTAEPIPAFGMLLIAAGVALMLSGLAHHSHETSDAHTI